MSVGNCKGCGVELPPSLGSGRRREWCSDRCRKRTCYSGTCVDCGGRTDGTASGKAREPDRCFRCQRAIKADRNAQILELWEAGASGSSIAEQLGMKEPTVLAWISRERERGRVIGLHRLGGDAEEREARRRQMIELRRVGKTNAEIAKICGFSSATSVSNRFSEMRRNGMEVPDAALGRRAA